MSKADPLARKRTCIAQDAYRECLKACEAFDEFLEFTLARGADQVWWKETYENHPEELAQRIRKHLIEATMTDTGCLVAGTKGPTSPKTVPQRVYWRGRRQKVYQLVAWGLLGELPTKRSVVRHLCNNRTCIRPLHLKIGTQAQNLRDQQLSRIQDWPHQ
ncbi:MAG: HNH endonuclease [Rhodobacteraceae bacterium]|nr:HNH endonuclease [Paracoccaceae bacterium]